MSLNNALELHRKGELVKAETEYRRILDEDPACHQALHGLGLIMHRRGQYALAASLVEHALSVCPGHADYHYHLAELKRETGRFEEALKGYREAIRRNGAEADYHFGLGNALAEKGDGAEAVAAFRTASRLAPDDAEIHNNLGNALAAEHDLERAVEHLGRAVELNPRYADAHHNLSLVLAKTGRTRRALEAAARACELDPSRAEPLFNLGRLLDRVANVSAAIQAYQRSAALAMDNPATLAAIADALVRCGHPRPALDLWHRVVELEPRVAAHYAGLSYCLIQLQRFEEAETQSREALNIDSACAAALGTLAACLQTRGRFEEARGVLHQTLTLKPALTEAMYLLAADGGYDPSDGELDQWLELALDPGLPEDKRLHLHFAVGKVYERRRHYGSAFRHFTRANQIKSELRPFDPARHTDYVEHIVRMFGADFFSRRRDFGVDDERMIFIVGMPRSGSTLVEQVLAGHPDVAAAGENPGIRDIVRSLPETIGSPDPVPECCRDLSRRETEVLAAQYLENLPNTAPGASSRTTDKMLGNFLRLGVVALLFPGARVVHCVRDPLDTCISCYTQDFAQGLRFTTSLENLASFYRDYRRLMAHWREVLPLPMFEVEYESLVQGPDELTRRLVEFCGLPWNDRCLHPERVERQLATASVWQARQPMYRSSVARWRCYEKFLAPLIDALGPARGG